ncbi:hypothetical protein [Leeuwenhoekiella palythoae]|uniref:hypothetical protein n=1 Tax=Leeuwenhoekiella palythoae TaxID=573501 RepID=UPI003515BC3D
MSDLDTYDDAAALEHFYTLALQAALVRTEEASAKAYEAMLEVQALLVAHDRARFEDVLETLPNSFYDLYVADLINEIDFNALFYFIDHHSILGLLADDHYTYVKHQLQVKGGDAPAAYDFICGLEHFMQGSPELALPYFTKIDSELGEYFLGMCYYQLKDYEHAKRLLQALFESLLSLQQDYEEFQTHETYGYLLYDLSHYALEANVILEDYKEAERTAQLILQEFSLEQLAALSRNNTTAIEEITDFEVFVNNYTTALIKLRKYKEAKALLEESIRLNPEASLIQRRLQNSADQLERQLFADAILAPILHKEKAYGVKEFLKGKRFARADKLEELLALQIEAGIPVFGEPLAIYEDEYGYGRQYKVPGVTGLIDLVLIDQTAALLYAVVLKPDSRGVAIYEQIKKYTQRLEQLTGKTVKGILCIQQPKEALLAKVKADDTISLFTYHLEFKELG